MKKLWSFLLCAALLCALCACGGQTSQTEDAPAPADAGEPAGRSAPAEAAPAQDPVKPEADSGQDQPESAAGEKDSPGAEAQVPEADTPEEAPAKDQTEPVQTEKPTEKPKSLFKIF